MLNIATRALACFIAGAAAYDLAHTPPLGYNSWDHLQGRVSAQLLMEQAQAMVDTGLFAAGYVFVNSDDGWDTLNRSAAGDLVADPAKFPQGWPAVTSFIHRLGMKAGLYTSKSELTCGGLAASCKHEVRDAALFASWQIDYVKEDSCGSCRNNDTLDYVVMNDAIVATGRPMIQTDEGAPDNANCSATMRCGNAKARRPRPSRPLAPDGQPHRHRLGPVALRAQLEWQRRLVERS